MLSKGAANKRVNGEVRNDVDQRTGVDRVWIERKVASTRKNSLGRRLRMIKCQNIYSYRLRRICTTSLNKGQRTAKFSGEHRSITRATLDND